MNPVLALRVIGIYAMIFGATLIGPVLVGLIYRESATLHFLWPMAACLGVGSLLWLTGLRHPTRELGVRDGYLVVTLFWVLLSALGAWPLMNALGLSAVDALFESTSGFTTTGATVLTGLDALPRSVLFYRQQLQWYGGMGLVVLGVAVMPMLGIGGMQLYRAEAPGPLKEEKLTPRLTHTARALWLLYLGLTILCAVGYWFAGMTPFDAIAHSLSTLSTGGFSTHDASIGYYQSTSVEAVAIVFMLARGHQFRGPLRRLDAPQPLVYLRDVEARSLPASSSLGVVLLVGLLLTLEGPYPTLLDSLRHASFTVVSVVTSTGFGIVDFSHWPDFLPVLMIYISFVGGCGGSTAGGMKVLRVLLMVKQGTQEVSRLIHPHAQIPIRLGHRVVQPELARSVWGFFALYTVALAVLTLLMIHAGLQPLDAFSAVATSLNNLGPGLGEVASNFTGVSDLGKLLAVVGMLLGRLEILTILVILSPGFWAR